MLICVLLLLQHIATVIGFSAALPCRPIVVCSTVTAGLLLPKPRKSAAIPIRAPGASAVLILNPGTGTPVSSSSSSSWPAQAQQQQQQLLMSPAVHFDLVVVDEAGQGLAPEVLLPLSLAKAGVSAGSLSLRIFEAFSVGSATK
jgi:hypothetical protein